MTTLKYCLPLLLFIALLVWGAAGLFQPATYGIEPSIYEGGQDTVPELVRFEGAPRPNIVVILADDLGYGDVGVYGGSVIATPHMDRLAADGLRFESAYSSAPICSPSRAGLLTGRYPLRSGIVQAMQAAGDSLARRLSMELGMAMSNLGSIDMRGGHNMVKGLPLDELTVAELLREAGYRTAAFGKWHLGDFTEWQQYHPFRHGFDHFVGFNMSNDDWPVAFYEGDTKVIADIGLDQAHYTALFTESAVEFIQESRESPFFVYLSHKDPHQPFYPSERFAGRSAGGPYGDAVAEFDWSVGEIRRALEQLGLAENTLLLVTSDNGPWYEGSSGGLRGRKGQSYEGGFRVPLLAWWPGTVLAGQSENTPVMNIDFLPTFAELAGIGLPADRRVDGNTLVPLLLNEGNDLRERPLYFFHDYDVEGVRIGDWKYLAANSHYVWPNPLDKQDSLAGRLISARDYSPPDSDESIPTLGTWPLLYNLERDPLEAYNVAQRHPQERERLSAVLTAFKTAFYDDPRRLGQAGR